MTDQCSTFLKMKYVAFIYSFGNVFSQKHIVQFKGLYRIYSPVLSPAVFSLFVLQSRVVFVYEAHKLKNTPFKF